MTEPESASSQKPRLPGAAIIGFVVLLLAVVVIALPLMLSKPEEAKTDPSTLGITGIHYAFLNDEYPVITRIDQDSPAFIAGLEKEDLLLQVQGMNASLLGDWDLNNALMGEPDQAVSVRIKSARDQKNHDHILYHARATDLPKSQEIKYLVRQAEMSRLDSMRERDAAARQDDFQYTSMIWYHLRQGPVVLEFHGHQKNNDSALAALIEKHNAGASEGDRSHITLISIDSSDRNYQPLVDHFKVSPNTIFYVFIPGNRGVISSRDTVGLMTDSEMKSRLEKLLSDASRPIADIVSSPQVREEDQILTGPEH